MHNISVMLRCNGKEEIKKKKVEKQLTWVKSITKKWPRYSLNTSHLQQQEIPLSWGSLSQFLSIFQERGTKEYLEKYIPW